jgi:hypothetical protein
VHRPGWGCAGLPPASFAWIADVLSWMDRRVKYLKAQNPGQSVPRLIISADLQEKPAVAIRSTSSMAEHDALKLKAPRQRLKAGIDDLDRGIWSRSRMRVTRTFLQC